MYKSLLCVGLCFGLFAVGAMASTKAPTTRQLVRSWMETGTKSPDEKAIISEFLQERRGRGDDGRSPLDYSAGPDAFGYRWVDNQNGDSATYGWVDICGDGLAVEAVAGDDAVALVPLGFDFPFYGGTYSSVYVSTNGLLTFGSEDTDYDNICPFANQEALQPTIALHWDDMVADEVGGCSATGPWIVYRNFVGYTVIEYKRLHHYDDGGDRFWFEIALYENGRVKMQYRQATAQGGRNEATCGIDAPGANNGIEYFCNATGQFLPNSQSVNRAVWFFKQATVTDDFGVYMLTTPYGQLGPQEISNVSANITNAGTNSGSGIVSFRFNGGAIFNEAIGPLAPGEVYAHTFAPTITMPAAEGDYPLAAWVTLAGDLDHGNDTLETMIHVEQCADWITSGPYPFTSPHRSSCDGDQCDLSGTASPEQIWQVNIPSTGEWTFSLCDDGTNYDSYLLLASVCCSDDFFDVIDENDDSFADCAANDLASEIECVEINAGTYYLHVEGYDETECGGYTLHIFPCGALPEPCNAIDDLSIVRSSVYADSLELHFYIETPSTARVYRTTNPVNDGNPDNGSDPDWVLVGTQFFAVGPSMMNTGLSVSYANYVVVRDCTPPVVLLPRPH